MYIDQEGIIIQNRLCKLVLQRSGRPRSLTLLATGEELLDAAQQLALFTVTQERPFQNEVKLSHPNKRTVFSAVSVDLQDEHTLLVRFETVPVQALIRVTERDSYLAFTLQEFVCDPAWYDNIAMKLPPVAELRLCQLALKNREKFGEWMNVLWDDTAAVNLLATSPAARIDSERRPGCRVLTADAVEGIELEGCTVALAVSHPDMLLDCVQQVEKDFGLPDGVASRRGELINASVYWTGDLCAANVDRHIARAKQGGFRLMLVYYTAVFKERNAYSLCGDYDYNEQYPNGRADLIYVLDKIKAAGITPGFHFLQTHIGMESRYVVPHADPRLGLSKHFTLARPLKDGDTELYVLENPAGTVRNHFCRYLKFGGELIRYTDYITTRPCRFTGIERCAWNTLPEEHPAGQIGGLLHISEFGGTSCYIDQDTDLQDEVAEKIADAYNAGFCFCYMDGSEGTNAPYEYQVPLAQYRVVRKFNQAPIFCEGAAKAHFSWHFQSGANAFDVWPPQKFKQAIIDYPAEEAPRMQQDFTRLDFGWWGFWTPREEDDGIQADHYEFGTSVAAGWDCPATVQTNLTLFDAHPRMDDILEVMRRWEDVRARKWLTAEQKEQLRNTAQEHTLLINETGEYELCPVTRLVAPPHISAYLLERNGRKTVVYWHCTGSCRLAVELPAEITVSDTIGGKPLAVAKEAGRYLLPAEGKRYLVTDASAEQIIHAFQNAQLKQK